MTGVQTCALPISCTCIAETFYPHLSTIPTALTCSWLLLLLPHNLTMQLAAMCLALFRSNQTVHNAIDTQKATTSVCLIHGIGAHCVFSHSVHSFVARAHSPRDLLNSPETCWISPEMPSSAGQRPVQNVNNCNQL